MIFILTFLLFLYEVDSHGYVYNPPSRAFLCKEKINKNCGNVIYEPQSLESVKGFPRHGPKDGTLASAGLKKFKQLDEYGLNRWTKYKLNIKKKNQKDYIIIKWYLTTPHKTSNFKLYMSNKNYKENKPLERKMFSETPICNVTFQGYIPKPETFIYCILDEVPKKTGALYSVWDIEDTNKAFYQIIDFDMTKKLPSILTP